MDGIKEQTNKTETIQQEKPSDAKPVNSQVNLSVPFRSAFGEIAKPLCIVFACLLSLVAAAICLCVIALFICGAYMLITQNEARLEIFHWLGGIVVGLMTNFCWGSIKNKS